MTEKIRSFIRLADAINCLTMPISKRNMIIVGAVALTVAVVIVVVSVVIFVVTGSKTAIFKGCDGRTEHIEEITISSCPDSAKVGYCEIHRDCSMRVNMTFTPSKSK